MAKPVEDGTSLRQQVLQQVTALKGLWGNKRQLIFQALNLAMIVFSALMIWKSLMVITKSESPVVVVLRCAHPHPRGPPRPARSLAGAR